MSILWEFLCHFFSPHEQIVIFIHIIPPLHVCSYGYMSRCCLVWALIYTISAFLAGIYSAVLTHMAKWVVMRADHGQNPHENEDIYSHLRNLCVLSCVLSCLVMHVLSCCVLSCLELCLVLYLVLSCRVLCLFFTLLYSVSFHD